MTGDGASDGLVKVAMADGIGRIRLADPEHRNALSKRLSDDLAAAVELELKAQEWSVEQPAFTQAVKRIKREIAERTPRR